MHRRIPRLSEQELEVVTRRILGRGGVVVTRPSRETRESAGSSPAPSTIAKNAAYAPYKNKLEYTYAHVLHLEKSAGQIKDWGYETQSLKLAAGKYHRPDFTVWHLDGSIEQVQTKGYHKNMRASLTGLKWAAQRHPWFRFTIKRYKNGWTSEDVI